MKERGAMPTPALDPTTTDPQQTTGVAATPATGPTPPPATPEATQDPHDVLGDPGKAALDAERKARRDAERLAKELQQKVADFELQGKTDLEKAQARAVAAEKERDVLSQAARQRHEADILSDAARKARATNPELVARLLATQVKFDDNGTPDGLDAAIVALGKSDAYP
jgi:hypothetical protein